MKGFVPARCATLLVPSGPANDPDRKHLHVLLTNPSGPGNQVLMAPICSIEPNRFYDPACVLAAGDHPFVQHASYVAYSKCRVVAAADVVKLVSTGYFVEREPASEELVDHIVDGVFSSKFVKPFARDFYRDYE